MSIKRFSEFLDEFGGRSHTGRSGFGNSDSRKLDLSKKREIFTFSQNGERVLFDVAKANVDYYISSKPETLSDATTRANSWAKKHNKKNMVKIDVGEF